MITILNRKIRDSGQATVGLIKKAKTMNTVGTKTKTAQIKCINKDDRYDPHERITHVGGYGTKQWKLTQEEAIRYIESREWDFYVSVDGKNVWVDVAVSRYGNKYLKTRADGDEPNNLLSLPECP